MSARLKADADLILHRLLGWVPTEAASAFGAFAASIRGAKAYPEADLLARDNLRRLRPDLSEVEIKEWGERRWREIGRHFAEYAVIHRFMAQKRVTVVEPHYIAEATRDGPCLLLPVHLSHWEVTGLVMMAHGIPPWTFYEPQASPSREAISRRSRERIGARLLTPDVAGLRQALRAFAAGESVALFAEDSVDGRVGAPLFGRPPSLKGNLAYAARLARKADVPILPGYVLRQGGARFTCTALPPLRLDPGPATDDQILADVARINAVLEPVVLRHLDQWYYLHERLDEPTPSESP